MKAMISMCAARSTFSPAGPKGPAPGLKQPALRVIRLGTFTVAAIAASACARHVPEPPTRVPGVPYVSWVVMSGDSDNPDEDFVCQSDPRNDCEMPASRADARVFSDVHVYYHGVGPQTRYLGSLHIGFFQGSATAARTQVDIAVQKDGAIANQSVTGIVTSVPGTYAIDFDLIATTDANRNQPIRSQLRVVVK
jgi:hypothetical protein